MPQSVQMDEEPTAPLPPAAAPAADPALPEPIFPLRPELLTDEPWPGDGERHWTPGLLFDGR